MCGESCKADDITAQKKTQFQYPPCPVLDKFLIQLLKPHFTIIQSVQAADLMTVYVPGLLEDRAGWARTECTLILTSSRPDLTM